MVPLVVMKYGTMRRDERYVKGVMVSVVFVSVDGGVVGCVVSSCGWCAMFFEYADIYYIARFSFLNKT